MAEKKSPALKQFSFGGCDFAGTSPANLADLSADTRILSLAITFEEALKLHLAVGECIRKLNSYKRSTNAGKRTVLNIAVHLSKRRITINETTRRSPQDTPSVNS